MTQFSRIGLDTSKAVFTLHCVDDAGKALLRINLRRAQLLPFFRKHAATVVAMEACGGSAPLGPQTSRAGPRGAADPGAVRQALPEARQERPQRRRWCGSQRNRSFVT